VVATFIFVCLTEKDVPHVGFPLELMCGHIFLWHLKDIFMLPLPMEVMVDGMVSLDASSSSKNLAFAK